MHNVPDYHLQRCVYSTLCFLVHFEHVEDGFVDLPVIEALEFVQNLLPLCLG
jgi:hypothetical protein